MTEGEMPVRDGTSPGHPDDGCSLCGDAAERATVLEVDAAARSARVETSCGVVDVALDLVDLPRRGDVLLVHQGFAIAALAAPGELQERGVTR